MALDEYLYAKFVKYFNNRKKDDEGLLLRRVKLDEIRPRLTIFARALSGLPIDLYAAEREGGYKNNYFFLPESMALFADKQDNLGYYLFRAIYMAEQQKLNLNWEDDAEHGIEQSRAKARETANQVLDKLQLEFPVAAELHKHLKAQLVGASGKTGKTDLSWLYGKWMRNERQQQHRQLKNFDEKIKAIAQNRPQTTLKAKAVEDIVHVVPDKKTQEDALLNHYFEKVETADEFNGGWRNFDGSDELEKHSDALNELGMKFTVRVDDTTHSVYQAEFTENTTIPESAAAESAGLHFSYDEWDYAKRLYKEGFCKVYPKLPSTTSPAYYQKVIAENQASLNELRKMLASVNNKWHQTRYQNQGDNFDIDAVTDMFVDIHAGKTPSEKIYFSDRKNDRDISILLLLDSSLSTDGYAAGNHVIDVEKQVSILFGEILNEYGIDFSISSFHSKTRNFTSFFTIKGFDEKWEASRNRIGAIEPNGFTRIGAAVRHAGAITAARQTKNKWVILISDGKPNDYDKYEGRYGIYDVKKALNELHENHVNAFALAIEAQAKYYLPQMFGKGQYQILTNPKEMITALIRLFTKIKQK